MSESDKNLRPPEPGPKSWGFDVSNLRTIFQHRGVTQPSQIFAGIRQSTTELLTVESEAMIGENKAY